MIPLNEAFQAEIRELLKDEAPAFFAAMEDRPALALRLNPARAGAMAVAEEYIEAPVPWEARGYYLKSGVRPGASIAHEAGAFYLQEASAMVSVNVLKPLPGERILDLCAAPGGKSTQIAAAMAGEGLLVANEPDGGRARILAANLERMGARNAVVVNAYPEKLAERWGAQFDAILCDAPCSGEGMFRREPEARLQWKSGAPAGCARRQAGILDRAAELLRPGGRLVYSTCTFNRTENEDTISAFLERHPEFAPEEFELPGLGRSTNGMIRIWPQRVRGDGHFAARLRKSGEAAPLRLKPIRADKESHDLLLRLEAEAGILPENLKKQLLRWGDTLFALPEGCPDLEGVKVIAPGVRLLRAGRSHIEPNHALAMAMNPESARQVMEISDDEARSFLAAHPIPCPESLRGWTLILWRHLPLGWAKASSSLLKPHRAGCARCH